ncbi:mechanosensitive ion channel family protein [bacterium]|nr:mechanosensitive ion channel family protein [bacterium]
MNLLLLNLLFSATKTETTLTETRIYPHFDFSSYFPLWMSKTFMGVAIWQFITAFIFVLLGFVAKKISDYFIETKLIKIVKKTRFELDDLIVKAFSRPFGFALVLIGISFAIGVLPIPPVAEKFVFAAVKIAGVIIFLWFLFRLVDVGVYYLSKLAKKTESKLDDQLVPLISKSLKATIGIICFLWLFQLLGYNVSSLLAGLGIGGLAVALALQDTLSNFFGSVFIFLDRPFMVGDWVKIGDVEGIVEDIGFRSTRIRTWLKTLVSIPNKNVANATIDNWSRMPRRRVFQTIGLTYETTADQMEKAVEEIKKIIENDPGVDKNFIVVKFSEFGDSSLNITVIYFTIDTTLKGHLETKERINLSIMRKLSDLGLSIAFPTMSIYLEKGNLKIEKKD